MKVRYNRAVGVVMLVLGAVCDLFGLWLFALGEFNPSVIIGLMSMLGVLYLVRPYFWVWSKAVEVPALFAPVRREFPFERLEVAGGRLFAVRGDGSRKKVPVARWLAHPGDWAAVTSARTTPAGQ